ncbi:MAG: RluA family pseudouridine synthase [Elusimicrobiota bacterium]|jgi:23S rRNA pseudouridine1911/1915/1917 synthase|nr:RluA family pseudouridine synthase [Elusimicrobiota bacterium]
MEKIKYEDFVRQRADSFLASIYKEYSRSYFQKLIENNQVIINSKTINSSYKLKHGDTLEIDFSPTTQNTDIKPQKIKLDIIYEDDDLIVINKPSAIVVHPSYAHSDGTLLNALSGYADGKFIPYLVHRLDKDTTGLIIFAKNEKSRTSLSKQFQNRAVKKLYYAAVKGTIVEDKGRIEAPLGRSPQNRKIISVNPTAKKMAVSEFNVIARKDGYTLVEVRIITGRTHQIRSHMKYINHPVIGDKEYGGQYSVNGIDCDRPMLHSHQISFTHPKTSKSLTFNAPLPKDMRKIFEK